LYAVCPDVEGTFSAHHAARATHCAAMMVARQVMDKTGVRADERARAGFFERMRRASEHANLSPEEADQLAAEALAAVRENQDEDA
jgi:hypothetical protein